MDSVTYGSHRLVHLDLKGAPPKLAYLEKLFPLLRRWGATGVLIEWEDTFPYSGRLQEVGGNSAWAEALCSPYSTLEAQQILQMAEQNDLIVIQLIQAMGHLEYLLKHDSFSGMREVSKYPSSICPSHSESSSVVRNMLDQALALQTNAEYIHIGADEVWHMGLCSDCSRRASENKYGTPSLFLDHITGILSYLKDTYPLLKVIMWDDMLRGISSNVLQEYNLGSLVVPMVWHYNPAVSFNLGPQLWEKYMLVFDSVWIASAFKGATGSCQIVPSLGDHLSNHEAWIKELELNSNTIKKVNGITFTGWSRYDHYATMCELLPVAIPSLVFCLQTWCCTLETSNRDVVYNLTSALLGYNPDKPLPMENASFPGWQITKSAHAFILIRERSRLLLYGDTVQTWLNTWQLKQQYTNPMQIEGILVAANELLLELGSLEAYMHEHSEDVFYAHTLEEWIGTNILPIKSQLLQLVDNTQHQLSLGVCRRVVKS